MNMLRQCMMPVLHQGLITWKLAIAVLRKHSQEMRLAAEKENFEKAQNKKGYGFKM